MDQISEFTILDQWIECPSLSSVSIPQVHSGYSPRCSAGNSAWKLLVSGKSPSTKQVLAGATSSSSSSSSPSSLSFSQTSSLSPSSRYSTATITTTSSSHSTFSKDAGNVVTRKKLFPTFSTIVNLITPTSPKHMMRFSTGFGPCPRIKCQVPETNSMLRLDLVVFNREEKKVIVVDVAVAFDEKEALDDARCQEKLLKYSDLAHELRRKGYEVQLEAFVMGSMLPENHRCLRVLGIKPSYAQLMLKLMVTDCIRWLRHRLHSEEPKRRELKSAGCPPTEHPTAEITEVEVSTTRLPIENNKQSYRSLNFTFHTASMQSSPLLLSTVSFTEDYLPPGTSLLLHLQRLHPMTTAQLVPEQITQLAHRIKSNLINMDKDISTSRPCLLSASKFLATCYNIEFLSFKHAPPHQHSSWTTASKRQHTFHQRSLRTNRTSRDSSEQPFLRLHQSSSNEQHQQHITSSQTEARTSIQ